MPTDASMAAAVKDMTVNPDGITRSMNYADKDPAAYPLTHTSDQDVPATSVTWKCAGSNGIRRQARPFQCMT